MARDQWLDVEVRHLAALEAVSVEGSFSAAAKRLGYVQSAISQQIAFLERAAGVTLVQRSRGPGRVRLTPAGEIVLERVKDVLEQLHAAQAELVELAHREHQTVHLGLAPGPMAAIIATVVGQLTELHPDVLLDSRDFDDEADLVAQTADGDIELALTELPLDSAGLTCVALASERHVILASVDSPLVLAGSEHALSELAGHRFLVPPVSRSVAAVEQWFADRDVELRIAHRSSDAGTIAAWIDGDLGLAIVPSRAPAVEWPGQAVVATAEPLPVRTLGLAWSAHDQLSGVAAIVRDAAVVACADRRSAPDG